MKFIDLFSGIGTVRMGFEKAGHECVYSVEWDKHKRRIYGIIFGEEPEGSDICAVRASDIPRAECWTFGAPCQDFSLAGARNGLGGGRSSLVREVFRLVRETKEEYRPKWLLYENVRGMLSSNKGFDYLKILAEMEDLGYDIEWQMLNSKHFGVPQNRERVFTLGHLRNRGGSKIFPIGGTTTEVDIKVIGTTAQSVIRPDGSIIMDKSTRAWVHDTKGIVGAIGADDYKQPKQILVVGDLNRPGWHELSCRIYDTKGISPTLNTCKGGGHETKILVKENTKKGYIEGEPGDGIRLDHPGGTTGRGRIQKQLSPTLLASDGVGTITNDLKIRKLTPKEYWRLQGIEDSITDKVMASGISNTQMYRGAGDACTVNVIYEIAKRLI